MNSNRTNVLLICVDQWRGDCLSIDNHPVVHTPYLDQLASRGARFSRAYSATPTCIPARAALHTGLSQASHRRVGYQDGIAWNYPVTLAGEFSRNGYQTHAVGKMHVYPERSRMGFDQVELHDGFLHFARRNSDSPAQIDDYVPWLQRQLGYEADYFDHGVNCNSYVARPWDKPEYTHPTNWVATKTVEFLRSRDRSQPFFLFTSFHRPHPPYDPPKWAFDMYAAQEMPDVPVGDWYSKVKRFADQDSPECFVGKVDPRWHKRARAGYYGHMTHIDHQINRIIETLSETGAGDNTVICFTSDHGEMMGDHHLWRKGYPYEGSSRIPLILFGPDDSGIKAGEKHDNLVELRDIMPTLLASAGLEIPPSIEGVSFLPVARDESMQTRSHLHGEHVLFDQSIQWIVSEGLKYVWWSETGDEQFFNMIDDPDECQDLASDPDWSSDLIRLRELLVHELQEREEGASDGTRLIAGRSFSPVLKEDSQLSS